MTHRTTEGRWNDRCPMWQAVGWPVFTVAHLAFGLALWIATREVAQAVRATPHRHAA